MAITLYDATVPTFLQVLGSLRAVLDKGQAHAQASGVDPESLLEARLVEDMFPLTRQVQIAVHHSAGALDDVSKGAFSLPQPKPYDYAGLQQLLAESEAAVRGWTPEAVNALESREVTLDRRGGSTFAGAAFLLSFSLPNFFFHGVTAYDILRTSGVPLGKMDYLGALRTSLR